MKDDSVVKVNGRRHKFLIIWKLEDNFNFWQNGRRHQFFCKIEDNLNFSAKWKTTSFFRKIEEDINLYANEENYFYQCQKKMPP